MAVSWSKGDKVIAVAIMRGDRSRWRWNRLPEGGDPAAQQCG